MTVWSQSLHKLPSIALGAMILLSSFAAEAAKERPCWLNLVVDNTQGKEATVLEPSNATSNANAQFLQFVRDLQAIGVGFPEVTEHAVRETFAKQSKKNLKRMIKNYHLWLAQKNRTPVPFEGSEELFVYWKDHFSPANGGRGHVALKTDREVEPSELRSKSLWSVAFGGFNGVLFNLEAIKEIPEDFVNRTQSNGIARVALTMDPDWAYVLPLPGSPSGDPSYSGVDTRFFAFLAIFAPDVMETFAQNVRVLLPGLSGKPEELLHPGILRSIAEFNTSEESLKFLRGMKEHLAGLTLSPQDAAYLLSYVAVQAKATGKISENFDVVNDYGIHSLTAVVSGQIGPENYLLKERPFVPPFVGPGGVSGWMVKPGSKLAPNMTGDSWIIPGGPQIY